MSFQHTTQRSLLERWRIHRFIYRISKNGRAGRAYQSARHIEGFGAEDWQSPEMENAFADVERVVGYTAHEGELRAPDKITKLTKWLALHFVRSRRHRESALSGGRNYKQAIDLVDWKLRGQFGFFFDFKCPVLIIGDNPVLLIAAERQPDTQWIVAPVAPNRCIYIVPKDAIPSELDFVGFKASTINQWTVNAATEYCISFDKSLHLP